MERIFRMDGPVMEFLNRTGQIIIVNMLWLVCCIPVLTIGPATISMYYAMTKSVKHGRSYPAKEFFRSFRRTLPSGCLLTAGLLAWGYLWYINRGYVSGSADASALLLAAAYDAFAVLTAGMLLYLFPLLSRFSIKFCKILAMSFVMMFRHILVTLLLAAGLAICALLVWLLPVPAVLLLPGVYCYLASFPMDRVLLRYMPEPGQEEDAWYYENNKKTGGKQE